MLSGILITVGIGVMDYKGLGAISKLPKNMKLGPVKLNSEVLIMIVVMLLSIFWDLIFAVGIGLIISCFMFMKLIGDLTAKHSQIEELKEEAWPDEIGSPKALKGGVFIKHIKGPLFFGYTSEFQQLCKQVPDNATTVVIRLSKMQYIDQSGLFVMEDILLDLKLKKIGIVLVGLLPQPRYMMEQIDLIPDVIPEVQIYQTFQDYLDRVPK